MKFNIITIFPRIFDSYIQESIIKRAQEKKLVSIETHDLRDFTSDKHKTVDDKPYGGGAGMVLKPQPILDAVSAITGTSKKKNAHVVILSAKGKPFTQNMARLWAKKYDSILFISGRYEGIDERVKKVLKAEEVSIGPYVLTDGDVAAMVIISAITRLVPGVITCESLEEESHGSQPLKKETSKKNVGALEYPHYTRPEILQYEGKAYRVPKVLMSGNHKDIENWRKNSRRS